MPDTPQDEMMEIYDEDVSELKRAADRWRQALVNEMAAEESCEGGGPYSITLDGVIPPLTKEETDELLRDVAQAARTP